MTMSLTDWCCAGCKRPWVHYPAIKIPSGNVDKSNYPILAVEYNKYCYRCALSILTPPLVRKWWKPWTWFRIDGHRINRETFDLQSIDETTLEQIYAELPGR